MVLLLIIFISEGERMNSDRQKELSTYPLFVPVVCVEASGISFGRTGGKQQV